MHQVVQKGITGVYCTSEVYAQDLSHAKQVFHHWAAFQTKSSWFRYKNQFCKGYL